MDTQRDREIQEAYEQDADATHHQLKTYWRDHPDIIRTVTDAGNR